METFGFESLYGHHKQDHEFVNQKSHAASVEDMVSVSVIAYDDVARNGRVTGL